MVFDGFLFGNGLTRNLLGQINEYIPDNKKYLLDIDRFMKKLLAEELSEREKRKVFSFLYGKEYLQHGKCIEIVKEYLSEYYSKGNSNIEYWLGVDLFQQDKCGYHYEQMKLLFPMLFYVWNEIVHNYLIDFGHGMRINTFAESCKSILTQKAAIFTTNYDRFFETLSPRHLHGIYQPHLKSCQEAVFVYTGEKDFLYKWIWGWNGIGKLAAIQEIKRYSHYSQYFDFSFFDDQNLVLDSLLIYGMGFQHSGYATVMAQSKPEYYDPHLGAVIDEHILMRLAVMQQQKQLGRITFAYYDEAAKRHYEKLANGFHLQHVNYIPCREIPFHI